MENIGQQQVTTFRAPAAKWREAVAFFLMMGMIGLKIYPVLLLLLIFFIRQWRTNRYAFLVEIFFFLGGYGFMSAEILPIPISDIGFLMGIVTLMIYRKNKTVRNLTIATIVYFICVILIAMTSLESMSVQMFRMRRYFSIIIFFLPLLIFVNQQFDMRKFRDSLVLHILVICVFYIIDTFIFNGFILVPDSAFAGAESTIFSPLIYSFGFMPRHYPQGLYWMIPCIIWLNYKYIKLSPIQWIIIILALFATRTNSLNFALIVCWIIFRPNQRRILKYALIGIVALFALYFVDNAMGRYLRVADNIDQFTMLNAAQDEEDLAEFGTGRMAQIIPKWLLLDELDRYAFGFGFIHPQKTTNPIFQIHNDLYSDVTQSDEIATEVEVTQIQTIFDIGLVGLLLQLTYFISIFYLIKPLKFSSEYLNVLVGMSILGIGGFAGLNAPHGLFIIGLILGCILLANKPMSLTLNNQPTE